MVSLISYLNADWRADDGGELLIYGPDGAVAAQIRPEIGTTVLLLSEEVEHEVRPCRADRFAIAGWWRVNEDLGGLPRPMGSHRPL